MNKLEYPKCPYCGKKVSYLRSGYLMNKAEYKCEACEKTSGVTVKNSVFGLVRVAFGIILLAVLFASFFRNFVPLEVDIIVITDIACVLLLPCYTDLVKKSDAIKGASEEKIKESAEN